MGLNQEEKTTGVSIKMKRIWRCIAFLLSFIFVFINCSYFFRPIDNASKNYRGFVKQPVNSLDVMMVGSSSIYEFWRPLQAWKEKGLTSYVFGTAGALPSFFISFLEQVLKRQTPKLFVIELRPFITIETQEVLQKDKRLRRITDNLPYSFYRYQLIEDVYSREADIQTTNRLELHLDLLKYHGRWKQLGLESLFLEKETFEQSRGYANLNEHEVFQQPLMTTKKVSAIHEKTGRELIELLDFCKASGIDTMFLFSPYVMTEQQQMVLNYLKARIKEYGFPCLDTNTLYDKMDLDFQTDFRNSTHVNVLGATKFTRYLEKYLCKTYALPDRRADPQYASWNQDYEVARRQMRRDRVIVRKLIADGQNSTGSENSQ